MTTGVIYEERGSDWSRQVSVVATTRWLQRDQTLPLSVKGVACETIQTAHINVSLCTGHLLDVLKHTANSNSLAGQTV